MVKIWVLRLNTTHFFNALNLFTLCKWSANKCLYLGIVWLNRVIV